MIWEGVVRGQSQASLSLPGLACSLGSGHLQELKEMIAKKVTAGAQAFWRGSLVGEGVVP